MTMLAASGITLAAIGALDGESASTNPPAVSDFRPSPLPSTTMSQDRPLIPRHLSLRSGPVEVPLRLRIASIGVDAPVVGVGLDSEGVMDAPMGPAESRVWRTAFWFRGGQEPGLPGISTIAGHLSGGRNPIFQDLENLKVGDTVGVLNSRDGVRSRFVVTRLRVLPADESDPTTLAGVFGEEAVDGLPPKSDPAGRAQLILITCAGDLIGDSYSKRLVVYTQAAHGS